MQPMQPPVPHRPQGTNTMPVIEAGLVIGGALALCSIGGCVFSGFVSALFIPDASMNLPLVCIFSVIFLAALAIIVAMVIFWARESSYWHQWMAQQAAAHHHAMVIAQQRSVASIQETW